MQVLIAVILVGGIVAIVVWAARAESEANQRREAVWRSFASRPGHQYLEPEGPWYRRKGARIEGEREGVRLTVDTYVVSNGKSHVTYTRVQGAHAGSPTGKLTVQRNGWWVRLCRRMGMRFVETGDRAFDERFAVRAKPEELVAILVPELARERIRAFPKGFTLAYRTGQTSLTWLGVESDEATIDAACAAVAGVCSEHRTSRSPSPTQQRSAGMRA